MVAVTRVGQSAVWADPDPAGLDAAVAAAGDALDLRIRADPARIWADVGFTALAADELVRPLPQVTDSVAATRDVGHRLAGLLRAGDLVLLTGPLGAGKTAFAQGIGAGLGVTGPVTSPTFVLARVHGGALPMVHVDAYRLRDSGTPWRELDDLDLEASLGDSVTVVEWGEGIAEGLAESRLEVELTRDDAGHPDRRTVRVRPVGERWALG